MVLDDGSPPWDPGANPGRKFGAKSPEAEAQMLTLMVTESDSLMTEF